MPSGPSIIYDKSCLQGLSLDEAFWLGMHYRTNLCPLFFVEVVADLHKPAPPGRTPEDVVRSLADKVAQLSIMPNIQHSDLIVGDLLGHKFPMDGRSLVSAGSRYITPNGELAEVMEESPESAAFNRWREHDFQTIDRVYAAQWRHTLAQIDLESIAALLKESLGGISFRDLAEIKRAADDATTQKNSRYRLLITRLSSLRLDAQLREKIISRWKKLGGPPLKDFAPYAHYCLTVDMFFRLAIASGHIAATRATNQVDIAYLYYLPFCNVFASADKLHSRCVPLFLRSDQEFIAAQDLKADLAKLVRYYDALPEKVKEPGAMRYGAYPPLEGEYLTSALHDRFFPGWRKQAANPIMPSAELSKEIMKTLKPIMDAAQRKSLPSAPPLTTFSSEDYADKTFIEHNVNRTVGRWKLF